MFLLSKIMKVAKSVNQNCRVQRIFSTNAKQNYENAIEGLNSLQTNAAALQSSITASQSHNLTHAKERFQLTYEYLRRSGLSIDELDSLSVIHISGTKGKGSTCAFVESILRSHGYRTGFYSSPHLVSVRERIRLNGEPITEKIFTDNFWTIYDRLCSTKNNDNDLPPYFKFLTLLAFNIFVKEKVDVAIIEVGIGGEYDCTNILRRVPVVGIASLGLDHTSILGNTIEEIAWQKGGIMKKNSQAFTVKQKYPKAYNVLRNRSIEKECYLQIAPCYNRYIWTGGKAPNFPGNREIQEINASLAIQLAHSWMYLKKHENFSDAEIPIILKIPPETVEGLNKCRWPGRFQTVDVKSIRFFFDGAHTEESIVYCRDWFLKNCEPSDNKVLVFNTTGVRESSHFLNLLSLCQFQHVYFTPNLAYASNEITQDQKNLNVTELQQLKRCNEHKNIWIKLMQNDSLSDRQSYNNKNIDVRVFQCASNVIEHLIKSNEPYRILVTGSLHLVGAFLRVLESQEKTV